jgi:ATP-dependent Clp protease ATP-binding subunit ClpX
MLELEGIGLTFEPAAVECIAGKTLKRGTGARGLKAVIEDLMRDLLFEVPSRTDVREVVFTKETVEEGVPPLLVLRPEVEKMEA